MRYQKYALFIFVAALMGVAGVGLFVHLHPTTKPLPTSLHVSSTTTSPQPAKYQNVFDKRAHSNTDPTSIWIVVNKQHPLNPRSYMPTDLQTPAVPLRVPGNESMQVRAVTARALEALFDGSKQKGLPLMLSSGYRSYTYQVGLYNSYVSGSGQQIADTQSARPGYSEHQTGFAADLEPVSRTCELDQCFGNTPEGIWLSANAYRYGFIIRYPQGFDNITGYEYEPWHVRYVGVDLATAMHDQGVVTLEQFFGIAGGNVYSN